MPPVIFATAVFMAADSWFLVALYSVLLSKHEKVRQYIKDIFKNATDLTAATVPIRLWCYGKWETINVEPTLPTESNKLFFLHSENRNVFWPALLQKAYYMWVFVDLYNDMYGTALCYTPKTFPMTLV